MVKARVLEERLIKMNKGGQGFFWIGGPGEEAFNVPLGLLINKGEGLNHDYLHFHYRQSATLLTMGIKMIDAIRQMHNTATDPYSGGRNFVNHYTVKEWNVVNVTTPIEVQYSVCIGSGVAQARNKAKGITIVTGGDAGTAEGEFQSCLLWSSRKGRELPILIIVTNNRWGISTPQKEVHPRTGIVERAKAFGIKTAVVDGNDVFASYEALKKAIDYVRKERKPFLIEANVSRLYGHSSASGANWVEGEADCIKEFEKRLKKEKIMKEEDFQKIRQQYEEAAKKALLQVLEEPMPDPVSIFNHVFVDRKDAEVVMPKWFHDRE